MDQATSAGIQEVAEGLLEGEATVTDSLAHAVSECTPDLGSEADRLIIASARANVRALAQLLTYPDMSGRHPAPPPETIAYMEMLVHRGLKIDLMVDGYRVAHANLWRHCVREASTRVDDPTLLPLVLEDASDLLYNYTNACIDTIVEEFQIAHSEHLRWPIARRLQAVVRVLDGEDVDPHELSTLLNYRIDGQHLGVVISPRSTESHVNSATPVSATVAATRIAKRLQPEPLFLVLPTGCDTVWLWVAAGTNLANLSAADMAEIAQTSGITVGVGEPRGGLRGFRETYLQAREAADCATALHRPFAQYKDIALVSTLCSDHSRALRLMHLALGRLACDEPTNARLRETLGTFLDSGLNLRAAARALGTHHHTVTYRLRQAEELLGHKIVEHAALIRSGLLIHQMFQESSGTFRHRGSPTGAASTESRVISPPLRFVSATAAPGTEPSRRPSSVRRMRPIGRSF